MKDSTGLQELIDEGCLSVIDMGNNGYIAEVMSMHERKTLSDPLVKSTGLASVVTEKYPLPGQRNFSVPTLGLRKDLEKEIEQGDHCGHLRLDVSTHFLGHMVELGHPC